MNPSCSNDNHGNLNETGPSTEELLTHVKVEPASSSSGDDSSDDSETEAENSAVAISSFQPVSNVLKTEISNETIRLCEEGNGAIDSLLLSNCTTRGKQIYRCKYCGYQVKRITTLKRHEQRHLDGTYKCHFCDFSSRIPHHLKEHESKHTGELLHQCQHCSYKTCHRADLNKHKRVHCAVKKFACHMCPFRCKWKRNLQVHLTRHFENRPFSCNECGLKFKIKTGLQTHKRIHRKIKPYNCDECSFRCRTNYELKSHKYSHSNVRMFPCTFPGCDQKCKTKSDLSKHTSRHINKRKFKCCLCQKAFNCRRDVQNHLMTHISTGKSFCCATCGKVFDKKASLLRHTKMHTTQRRFMCSICGHLFRAFYNMKNHMKVHEGGREFRCPFCIFGALTADGLTTHIGHMHLNEYTYFCELCLKPFGKLQNLKLHIERCHSGFSEDKHPRFIYNPDCCEHMPLMEKHPSTSGLETGIKTEVQKNAVEFSPTELCLPACATNQSLHESDVVKTLDHTDKRKEGSVIGCNHQDSQHVAGDTDDYIKSETIDGFSNSTGMLTSQPSSVHQWDEINSTNNLEMVPPQLKSSQQNNENASTLDELPLQDEPANQNVKDAFTDSLAMLLSQLESVDEGEAQQPTHQNKESQLIQQNEGLRSIQENKEIDSSQQSEELELAKQNKGDQCAHQTQSDELHLNLQSEELKSVEKKEEIQSSQQNKGQKLTEKQEGEQCTQPIGGLQSNQPNNGLQLTKQTAGLQSSQQNDTWFLIKQVTSLQNAHQNSDSQSIEHDANLVSVQESDQQSIQQNNLQPSQQNDLRSTVQNDLLNTHQNNQQSSLQNGPHSILQSDLQSILQNDLLCDQQNNPQPIQQSELQSNLDNSIQSNLENDLQSIQQNDPECPQQNSLSSTQTDSSSTQPNDPPPTQPNDPPPTQPNDPLPTQPNDPLPTQPNDPLPTQPNDPPPTQPNDPLPTQPNDPLSTQPNDPLSTQPNDPLPTQPNDPSSTQQNDPLSIQERDIQSTQQNDPLSTQQNDIPITLQNGLTSTQQKDPLSTQQNDLLSTQQNDPLCTQQNDPLSTQQNDILSTQQRDPLSTQQRDPLSTQQRDPLSTQQRDPLSTQQNDPLSTQQRDPLSTQQNDPLSTQQNDILSTQQNDLLSTQQRDTPSTQQNDLLSTQQNDPLCTQQNDPLSTQQNDPLSTQQSDPLSIQQNDLLSTQQNDPLSIQQNDPLSIQQSDPLSIQQSDPLSTQQSDPLSTQQSDPLSTQLSTQQSDPLSTQLSTQQSDPLSTQQTEPLSTQQSDPLSTQQSDPLSAQHDPLSKQQYDLQSTQDNDLLSTQQNVTLFSTKQNGDQASQKNLYHNDCVSHHNMEHTVAQCEVPGHLFSNSSQMKISPEKVPTDVFNELSQIDQGSSSHDVSENCKIGVEFRGNIPHVVKLGSFAGVNVCLASKNSNIVFNYEKSGKKPNRWFMEPSVMPAKAAKKFSDYKAKLKHSSKYTSPKRQKAKSLMVIRRKERIRSKEVMAVFDTTTDANEKISMKAEKYFERKQMSGGRKNKKSFAENSLSNKKKVNISELQPNVEVLIKDKPRGEKLRLCSPDLETVSGGGKSRERGRKKEKALSSKRCHIAQLQPVTEIFFGEGKASVGRKNAKLLSPKQQVVIKKEDVTDRLSNRELRVTVCRVDEEKNCSLISHAHPSCLGMGRKRSKGHSETSKGISAAVASEEYVPPFKVLRQADKCDVSECLKLNSMPKRKCVKKHVDFTTAFVEACCSKTSTDRELRRKSSGYYSSPPSIRHKRFHHMSSTSSMVKDCSVLLYDVCADTDMKLKHNDLKSRHTSGIFTPLDQKTQERSAEMKGRKASRAAEYAQIVKHKDVIKNVSVKLTRIDKMYNANDSVSALSEFALSMSNLKEKEDRSNKDTFHQRPSRCSTRANHFQKSESCSKRKILKYGLEPIAQKTENLEDNIVSSSKDNVHILTLEDFEKEQSKKQKVVLCLVDCLQENSDGSSSWKGVGKRDGKYGQIKKQKEELC